MIEELSPHYEDGSFNEQSALSIDGRVLRYCSMQSIA